MNQSTHRYIGVFGGTFDPIHHGHLAIVDNCLRQLNLDHCYMMPTHIPVDKTTSTSIKQRLDMIQLGIDHLGNDRISIDRREIVQAGLSYSYLSARSLRQDFPKSKIYFICGYDTYNSFHQWEHADEIMQHLNLLIVNRCGIEKQGPHEDAIEMLTPVSTREQDRDYGAFYELDYRAPSISSTEIRTQPQHYADFLPEPVLRYINEHELYTSAEHGIHGETL